MLPSRFLHSEPARLCPSSFYALRHVQALRDSFDALRLAEAADTLTRRLPLRDTSPARATVEGFVASYGHTWRLLASLQAEHLAATLKASDSPDRELLLARLPRDLEACHRHINAVLATRLSSRIASRATHNAMLWFRGCDRGEGGLLSEFKKADPRPVPAGWTSFLPWADLPPAAARSRMDDIAAHLEDIDPSHPAIKAYQTFLLAEQAGERKPEPKKRGPRIKGLTAKDRDDRRRAYMRDYMAARRAAGKSLDWAASKSAKAAKKAADQAAIDAAKTAYAAQLTTSLSTPPAEIDPLS
ncbi:MAG: hypothetical protein ACK5PF_09570 [bacterium]